MTGLQFDHFSWSEKCDGYVEVMAAAGRPMLFLVDKRGLILQELLGTPPASDCDPSDAARLNHHSAIDPGAGRHLRTLGREAQTAHLLSATRWLTQAAPALTRVPPHPQHYTVCPAGTGCDGPGALHPNEVFATSCTGPVMTALRRLSRRAGRCTPRCGRSRCRRGRCSGRSSR